MRTMRFSLLVLMLSTAIPVSVFGQAEVSARLKDLVTVQGSTRRQLTGYGIVVGLDRTGDRARGERGSPYTVQSIANMLQRFGITVNPAMLAARNTAAVMVTAMIESDRGAGSQIDVTVASLGDARSLSGGVLLQTPLTDIRTGQVFAMAQGPLSTGSVGASGSGSSVSKNHATTGRVPGGGIVTASLPALASADTLGLVLKEPDFTNAVRIADAINQAMPGAAEAVSSGLVRVVRPQDMGQARLIASLEPVEVSVDVPARVVINERTGTIVVGGAVRISEVMVTYGSVTVSTQTDPVISQPAPLSQGQTVSTTVATTEVAEDGVTSVILSPNTTVSELATMLNSLGLTARDVIAIFQAISRANALHGELIII
ncbi:MAG: flagellar basal body P-ring protein FlgI [Bacteroidetes bacterium]|nr:flagellar basal body P-ring protein FlgI [Bacteroidota bacterium]